MVDTALQWQTVKEEGWRGALDARADKGQQDE